MGRRARRCATLSLIVAVGCGGSSSGSGADAATRVDGGGGKNGGSEGGASTSGARGLVTIQQSFDSNNGMKTYMGPVNAFFSSDPASFATPSCDAAMTMGACQVQVCASAGAVAPPTQGAESAGTVNISGTLVPVMLTPDPDGVYEPFETSSTGPQFIPPTSTLEVSATGATVPAFQGSLSLGGAFTVTTPTLGALTTHLASGDVAFAWTGGGSSEGLQVFFSASAATDSSKTANVTCVFSGGTGTVPAAAMAAMGGVGSLALGPVATTNVTAGEYEVTINAQVISAVGLFTK